MQVVAGLVRLKQAQGRGPGRSRGSDDRAGWRG